MIMKSFASVNAGRSRNAFTLIELLISLAVTAMIILMVAQLMNSATAVARTGSKHIDTDTQARAILDRMAQDFAKMLKRTDVDYYIKAPIGYKNPKAHGKGLKLKTGEQGNDSIAFFSQVAGYYLSPGESAGAQSPVSLVAYRVNSAQTSSPTYLQLERMGKGLLWNGVNNGTTATSPYPIVFLPGQIAPPPPPANAPAIGPWAGPWYAAINNDNTPKSVDSDYETIGAQVFRFEYYYLMKDGSISDVPRIPKISWDFSRTISANLNAFSDVESIAVVIAVIDPASRSLLYDPSTPGDPYKRLFNLMSDMADFKNANGLGLGAQKIGDVENNWNLAVQNAASTGATSDGSAFPPAAASAVRIYNRYFDLRTPALF
jgi:prepilin-type N-terminal cleavage/methylation domain-containing protein